MEFYKIWQTRSGLIGVNKMTLLDLIGMNVMIFVLYLGLLALLVQVLPTLLLGLYVVLLLNNRISAEDGDFDIKQRLFVNILTVIAVIYFLLDFHFGWISFRICYTVVSKESYDTLAIFNMTIGVVNIILFFFGNDIFKKAPSMLVRLGMFVLLVYCGFKFGKPVSKYFITNVISQYSDAEIIQDRLEVQSYDYSTSDEEREQDRLEEEQEEADTQERLKKQDEEYVEKWLN